jgi:hypothetical protein
MSSSIFSNEQEMNMYDTIINKYSVNPYVSIEEMTLDFNVIKPSGNPINDICFIRIIGDYISNNMIYKQWEECPYIINEMYTMLCINFPDIYFTMYDFGSIIESHRNKLKTPKIIDLMVLDFIDPLFKKYFSLDIDPKKEYIKEYLDARNLLRIKSKEIITVYEIKWNDIESVFDELTDMVESKFDCIDNDPNYAIAVEIIENINYEANIKVEQLIKSTSGVMNLSRNIYESNYPKFDEIKMVLFNDFKSKLNSIYHDIIVTKNFDNTVYQIVSNLFESEKAKSVLFLQMEFLILSLRSL